MAQLCKRWEGLDGAAPVLVVQTRSVARWAQDADVFLAQDGLVVVRLFAPFAKMSQPAPGTVWPRALTSGEPRYPPIPPEPS